MGTCADGPASALRWPCTAVASRSATTPARRGPSTSTGSHVTALSDADDRRFEMCAMQMTTPWEGWTDPTTAHVKELLAAHFRYERADGKKAPLKFGGEAWHNALGALMYRREVDPFVEWIEGLPAWDGTPRRGHVA